MALKPIKVSQLNKYIGRVLQTDPILGNVAVTGEISNIKYHGSGHVYFTLKDEGSRISCFMHAGAVDKLRYELTDGMEIVVNGYISVYEKSGYYSLNVRDVQISGEGNLNAAYRALFDRLKKQGLFDEAHKKKLPVFPRKICVITSPTGAAVRDILKIIRSRNDIVDVMVYPCLVQGERAAEDIASAIADVNHRFSDTDIIITGRGGGSLEELWAFNEEIVAMAVYESDIPVISAVGHETDFSICDYVADLRAETPTAAAAAAVPDTGMLRRQLGDMFDILGHRLSHILEIREQRLRTLSPDNFTSLFLNRINTHEAMLMFHNIQLSNVLNRRMTEVQNSLEKSLLMLEAANPKRIIERGYAAVTDTVTGFPVTSVRQLSTGAGLKIYVKDGTFSVRVEGVEESVDE